MPAYNGYDMTAQRFTGSSTWTDIADFRNLTLSLSAATVDVTTHRHVDANGHIHGRNRRGVFSYTLTGEGIPHAQSMTWLRQHMSGEIDDDLIRIVLPNKAQYFRDYMFASEITYNGPHDGAFSLNFTFVPASYSQPGSTPAWEDE